MAVKTKWTLIAILTYVLFVMLVWTTKVLAPEKIGLSWSVFWYVMAGLICYYLRYKNIVFERVMYYARQLQLSKADLKQMLPEIKKSQDIPDPARPHLVSPLFSFSLQNLDSLDRQLLKLAKSKTIKPFR